MESVRMFNPSRGKKIKKEKKENIILFIHCLQNVNRSGKSGKIILFFKKETSQSVFGLIPSCGSERCLGSTAFQKVPFPRSDWWYHSDTKDCCSHWVALSSPGCLIWWKSFLIPVGGLEWQSTSTITQSLPCHLVIYIMLKIDISRFLTCFLTLTLVW